MKKPFLVGGIVLCLTLVALSPSGHALDFSEFVTRGYEGKAELEFNTPEDLLLGPNGEIIVADHKNNRIQILRPDGSFQRFITSSIDGKKLLHFGEDVARHQRRGAPPKPTATGKPEEKKPALPPPGKGITWYQDGASSTVLLLKPVGLALDVQGRLWVSCAGTHRVYIFRFSDGKPLGEFSGQGRQPGLLDTPMDIDVRADGHFAIADSGNKRVQIFDPNGNPIRQIHYKEEFKKGLRDLAPRGVLWARDGSLIVSYPTFHQVTAWNLEGELLWRYGQLGDGKGELNQPSFLAWGPAGQILVADSGNHRFILIDERGMLVRNFSVVRGTTPGRLLWPRGLALTSEEHLVIADSGNNRIHFFKPGRAFLMLREAKMLARSDQWDEAFTRIEQVLNLHPNNEEARGLMVNALHYFGDRAFQKADFTRAEEFFRRILIYRPNDETVPKKLDAIFWAENRDLIGKLIFGIIAVIATLILSWIVRTTFNKVVYGHP